MLKNIIVIFIIIPILFVFFLNLDVIGAFLKNQSVIGRIHTLFLK